MYRFCCAGQGAFHFLSDIGEVADNGTPTIALVPKVDLVRSLAEEGKILQLLEILIDLGVPFGLVRVEAAIGVIATGGSLAKSPHCKGCIRDLKR